MSIINIPPSEEVRRKLAAAQAEARYLRRLLKLAKEREEADRLSNLVRQLGRAVAHSVWKADQ